MAVQLSGLHFRDDRLPVSTFTVDECQYHLERVVSLIGEGTESGELLPSLRFSGQACQYAVGGPAALGDLLEMAYILAKPEYAPSTVVTALSRWARLARSGSAFAALNCA